MTEHPPTPAENDPSPERDDAYGGAFDGPSWQDEDRERTRTSPDQVRRRVRRRKPPRRKRRRVVLLGCAGLFVVIVAALGYLAYTAAQAKSELTAARAQVSTLRAQISAGELDAARATAASLEKHAHRADDLTSGPLWSVAASVPYLGDPLGTARTVSASVDRIATNALPSLIDASSSLDPSTLRRPDGSFDLAPIAAVAPVLDRAVSTLRGAVAEVGSSSSSTWIGSVNDARTALLNEISPLIGTLQDASTAAHTVPTLLGDTGQRRYLVMFQNEAELRGLGGLPGAFAVLGADHGKLTFERFESDSALVPYHDNIDFGEQYRNLWANDLDIHLNYLGSNQSPHLPYAARSWVDMWKAKTGEQADGVITLDPTAISYLLAVTGPATMADGTVVSADNVVRLTQQTAYDRYGTVALASKRKEFLLDLARAISKRLISSKADPSKLVKAAARAVGQQRLLVWTSDPAIEERLATTPIASQVPQTAEPYAALVFNNFGATKLDYYLSADVTRTESGCGATRDVTVTIKLTNRSPKSGLPQYVLGYTGRPHYPKIPGVNRTYMTYFATAGAHMDSITLDGAPSTASSGYERGHPVFGIVHDLPPGTTTTVVLHLTEPAAKGQLTTRMQPMVTPVTFSSHLAVCGN